MKQTGWRSWTKQAIDRVGAAAGLLALSPVMLAVAGTIKVAMPGPVFFRQRRPGREGRPFTILKFRTMTEELTASGELRPDEQRLTGLGRFLRRTSLDELPQLINVLQGELSFVGPRPLLMRYLSRYTAEQMRRHEVMPGITGWAQINGRNALSWEQKFELDLWYVDNWSLSLDGRILADTVSYVLKRKGITRGAGHATTTEFMGDQAPCGTGAH